MALFTPEERARVRDPLLALAEQDERVVAAAMTGSGAHAREDRWSDLDIAFAVDDSVELAALADEWTRRMYDSMPVLHHFAVAFGPTFVRGFLLDTSLEVDLSFTHARRFYPFGPDFRLVFDRRGGVEAVSEPWPQLDRANEAGLAWHDVLHALVAIRRGRFWRALYYVERLRTRTVELACARLGLDSSELRQVDELPREVLGPLAGTLARSLDPDELWRSTRTVTRSFLAELRWSDPELADRLEAPLLQLIDLYEADPG